MKKIVLGIILLIIFLIVAILSTIYLLYPVKYTEYISKYSQEFGLDKKLVYSVINIESSYKKDSLSKAGAVGLMQLLPSTASDMAKRLDIDDDFDLYNEEINIKLGCYYLAYLLDFYEGNVINSLCAYNWGLSNVNNWIKNGNKDKNGTITNIPVKETSNYIKKYKFNYFIYDKFHNIK